MVNFKKKANENKQCHDETLNKSDSDSVDDTNEDNSEKPDIPDDEWYDGSDCNKGCCD